VANARTFNTFLHQYGRMSLRHGLAMAVAVIAIQEQSERQRRGADERAGQLVRTVAGALRRSLSAAHVVGILEGNRIAVVFAGLGQTQADAALQAVFQQLKRQHRALSLVAATAELAHSSASSPEQPLNDAMHRLQAERNRQSAQDAAA
jgi:PleD family two-component response regulator